MSQSLLYVYILMFPVLVNIYSAPIFFILRVELIEISKGIISGDRYIFYRG